MDLGRIQWIPTALGAIAWALVIAFVWLRHREPTSALREGDFARWKVTHAEPHATFGEFLASEQAPRMYLGRASLCVVISAVALLVLLEAMGRWSVFD